MSGLTCRAIDDEGDEADQPMPRKTRKRRAQRAVLSDSSEDEQAKGIGPADLQEAVLANIRASDELDYRIINTDFVAFGTSDDAIQNYEHNLVPLLSEITGSRVVYPEDDSKPYILDFAFDQRHTYTVKQPESKFDKRNAFKCICHQVRHVLSSDT